MAEGEAVAIAVICEAEADRQIVCGLADRVLCNEVEWIEPPVLADYRRWCGLTSNEPFLKISTVHALARQKGLRAHGHFGDKPGEPMAHVARLAFLLLATSSAPPQGVVIVVDSDNHSDRVVGLTQARAERPWRFRNHTVIGVAHTKRECWVLTGFDPRDESEESRLAERRAYLGFNPTTDAHLLTAQTEGAKTDAKATLAFLTNNDQARQELCWKHCPMNTLELRGKESGLLDYLNEIRERLVSLFK